jgi:hypothetical protein
VEEEEVGDGAEDNDAKLRMLELVSGS